VTFHNTTLFIAFILLNQQHPARHLVRKQWHLCYALDARGGVSYVYMTGNKSFTVYKQKRRCLHFHFIISFSHCLSPWHDNNKK
jgi:hypothetical protein